MNRLLVCCSALLSQGVSNEEAWQHGRLLIVGDQQYLIDFNPPIVDKARADVVCSCTDATPFLSQQLSYHAALFVG